MIKTFELKFMDSAHVFMPPTLEILRGHIGLGLSFRISVALLVARKFKNHIFKDFESPYVADPYFYLPV